MTDRKEAIARELSKKAIPILMECPELFPIAQLAAERANPVDAKSHVVWQLEIFLKIICNEVAHHIVFFDGYAKKSLSDQLIKAGLFYVVSKFLSPLSLADLEKWESLREKYNF